MKRLLFACFLLLVSPICFAQETNSHKIIIDIDEQEESVKSIKLPDMIDTAIEVGIYFDSNYPQDKIETDLKPDIEKFFPQLSSQQLYNHETFIRNSVKLYRWGKQKYAEIKSLLLAPKLPTLTYEDKDYEKASDYSYVDVGEDNVLITTDIKKVISYSSDPKEKESYEAFIKRNRKDEKFEAIFPGIAKLKKLYEKIEVKKLPFYGILYDDPKTQGEGISSWNQQKHAKTRLATEFSRLEHNKQLRGAVNIKVDTNWFLLADNHQNYSAIHINFDKSQNLKNCNYFYPVPYRILFEDGDLISYVGEFAIPFICEIIDYNQNAIINANIEYALCNNEKQCIKNSSNQSLEISTGFGFETTMQSYIAQSFNHLPNSYSSDITIQDVSIEENPNSPTNQTLRIIIDSSNDFSKPEIFVKNNQHTTFARPRIAIDGKRLSARFDIISTGDSLVNTPIEITIKTDLSNSYRLTQNITSSSIFDINSTKLNLGLILLAILGGFILNFMPCVFPVLSLKILSLTHFGAKNNSQLKRNFSLSTLGIFCSFIILATILSILKAIGHNLGWGMQFQNPIFITTMIFIIILFLAQIHEIIPFNYSTLNKIANKKFTPSIEAFLSGVLVVVMSTPCTGPYLGTTIGFALSGSPIDIFAILLSVALGLSLPYIIMLISPNLSSFIPAPGEWMKKIHQFMVIMLILTIIWLCSILQAQSSWLTINSICILAILFYFVLYIYWHSRNEIAILTRQDKTLKKQSYKLVHTIFICILSVIFALCLIISQIGFSNHRAQVEQQSETTIDINQIGNFVEQGYNVLVKIGADWCLTCSYNDFLVFESLNTEALSKQYNIKIINIDWTEYNSEVLDFMSEYGRRGLPFYIIYNRNIPEGIVLPEILSQMEFEKIIKNIGVFPQNNELKPKEK